MHTTRIKMDGKIVIVKKKKEDVNKISSSSLSLNSIHSFFISVPIFRVLSSNPLGLFLVPRRIRKNIVLSFPNISVKQ